MEKKEFDKLPIGTKIHAQVENWYRRCRYELDFIIFKNFQGEVCAISNQEPNNEGSSLIWREYSWKELKDIKVIDKKKKSDKQLKEAKEIIAEMLAYGIQKLEVTERAKKFLEGFVKNE